MQKTKNTFLMGAVILVICNLITKIIGAIYRIPLLKILGSEGLGLYQLIFPIFAFMLGLASSGINVAVSKFVSRENAKYSKHNIKKYLQAGFIISFSISTFFAVLLGALTPIISKYQGESNLAICYYAILPSIILSSLISTLKGYFLGKHKMLYSGSIQVVEQIIKLLFSLLLANHFVKYGIIYAVFGTVLGITISEVFSLIFAFVLFLFNKKEIDANIILKNKSKFKLKNNEIANNNMQITLKNKTSRNISLKYAIKNIFNFGFFVSLESCIMPLLGAIDSLTIVPLLIRIGLNNTIAYTLFGLEDGIVASLVSMPTVIATSFGQSLIPNIKSKNIEKSQSNIAESFKIVWLIGIACAFVFIFFSGDIINFLYAGGLNSKIVYETQIATDLLRLNAFNIIYLSLLNLSSSILQGFEDSKTPVVNMGICAILRIVVLLLTVTSKSINIYGTAIADMLFYSLAFILNVRAIKKRVNIKFSISKFFVFPVVSAGIMCLTMKLFKVVLNGILSQRISTLIMGALGVFIYFLVLVLTKVLDVKKIFGMFFKKKEKQSS
ncbi:MAG: oligosaccharide flippase family protein [Christensenellales bacterium]